MLAFVAAVSFATIVAVVAALTLAAASSLAHDVYVGALKNGHATEKQQVSAARIATLLMAVISVAAGIAAKGQNVAQLVGLGYAVAASANLPALVGTLYWKRCNTAGVVAGVIGGTVLSIGLVLVSPNMTYPPMEREAAATANAVGAQLQQPASAAARDAPGYRFFAADAQRALRIALERTGRAPRNRHRRGASQRPLNSSLRTP